MFIMNMMMVMNNENGLGVPEPPVFVECTKSSETQSGVISERDELLTPNNHPTRPDEKSLVERQHSLYLIRSFISESLDASIGRSMNENDND